ncbi:hypothetical protein ANCCAN_01178, partial [Ancylostoma caninum]
REKNEAVVSETIPANGQRAVAPAQPSSTSYPFFLLWNLFSSNWKYEDPSEDKTKPKLGEESGRKDEKPMQVNGTSADRILFEAQLRRKIGHEYGIGHARILVSACTLLIAILFAWFLKYTILDGRITSDIKARKSKGDSWYFWSLSGIRSFLMTEYY